MLIKQVRESLNNYSNLLYYSLNSLLFVDSEIALKEQTGVIWGFLLVQEPPLRVASGS